MHSCPIGGFFELDLGPPLDGRHRASRSVAARWFEGAADLAGFRNARSALAFGILPEIPARTLWLPTYLCADLSSAASARINVRFYPLADQGALEPDPAWLDARLKPGDAVLVVDYFGKPPSAALRAFAAARPEIIWIEDRAQALWPGAPWGDVLLYSPRKLLGVGDGGFAVIPSDRSPRSLRAPTHAPAESGASAALARFEDTYGTRNTAWYAAYREGERRMGTSPLAASLLTQALLARIDFDHVAERRRRNFAALVSALPSSAVLDGYGADAGEEWVPQGVPVLVPHAPSAVAAMARARVFCPHLWPEVPGGPCRRTDRLRNRVVLLPCDQRYVPQDMARVASVFTELACAKAA